MFLLLLSVLCVTEGISVPVPRNENSLVLLHMIFRHGDRTPDLHEMYPNDPFQAEIYFPEGLGELTRAGKKREYDIGKSLRKKYDSFLGSYKSNEVFAMSTDYVRTKMSCLLVLAGLYPPDQSQVWETGLNWLPVPYTHNDYRTDYLLGDPIAVCPRFIKLYEDYLAKEGDAIYEKNKELYEYVSLHSGLNIKTIRQMYNLQFVLHAEEAMGLELPEWTKSVWPGNISRAAADEYLLTFATPQMKRLSGGPLLQKMIDDTKHKITNSSDTNKIYIYSSHENNVAYPLILFDAFHPHVPTYGSYVILEVHQINNIYGIKVFYEDYSKNSGYIKIGGCDEFCPFDKFIDLMKDNVPTKEDVCTLD